jgi:hypothetical protein
MSDNTLLCSNPRVTVASLKVMMAHEDRGGITEFVERRFLERYFDPIEALSAARKNGFSIMALCCLTVESLQCFREGLPISDGESRALFHRFFEREAEFIGFRGCWLGFYKYVRCGILHQGETTHGWRIRRSGPLFEAETPQINATKFQAALKKSLVDYVNELKREDFDSDSWINCKKKLNSIIANCKL